jgi:hypothetical protein
MSYRKFRNHKNATVNLAGFQTIDNVRLKAN